MCQNENMTGFHLRVKAVFKYRHRGFCSLSLGDLHEKVQT